MKMYLKFIKHWLNFLSIIAPKYGGKIVINIFQKVRIKRIKEAEKEFYSKMKPFKVSQKNNEALHCYELGKPNGRLVFLVHGWDSNAGSLTRFAFELANKGYRVISLDLPAHSNTEEIRTNLYICKNAFKALIDYINPKEPFSVIAHSFGSIVIAFALSETNYLVDKIVLLSANNKLKEVFLGFQKFIGFNDKIFRHIEIWIKNFFKEDLSEMKITNRLKTVNFEEMLIIHDKFDKVIPYRNAEEIVKIVQNTKVLAFERIGHYRMLWNEDVINETINFISTIKKR